MTDRRKMVKSLLISLGLVLLFIGTLYVFLGMSTVAQTPPFPHVFWGKLIVDGTSAPKFSVVKATGVDVRLGVQGNPLTTTETGVYGDPEPYLTVDGDYSTEALEFYISISGDLIGIDSDLEDLRARCYDPSADSWSDTYDFQFGAVTELDLFYTGTYTLMVVSDDCCPISVTYATNTDTIAAGAVDAFTNITGGVTVTLEAGIGPFCRFDGWEGDFESAANLITIPMRYENKMITATCFSLEEYTLTVGTSGSGEGAVIKTPDQVTYIHGTPVTLTADPSITSTFVGWSGDIEGDEELATFPMDDDKEITATFEFYSVTVSPPLLEQSGDPGEWMHYSLKARNTGGVADTYTVTPISSHDWPIDAVSSVGVDIDSERWVDVRVQIPPGASGGTGDVLTVTLTSQGDPRKSAVAFLKTAVTGDYTVFLPLVTRFD